MTDEERQGHTEPPELKRQEMEAEYEMDEGPLTEVEQEVVMRMDELERHRFDLSQAENRELIALRLVIVEKEEKERAMNELFQELIGR